VGNIFGNTQGVAGWAALPGKYCQHWPLERQAGPAAWYVGPRRRRVFRVPCSKLIKSFGNSRALNHACAQLTHPRGWPWGLDSLDLSETVWWDDGTNCWLGHQAALCECRVPFWDLRWEMAGGMGHAYHRRCHGCGVPTVYTVLSFMHCHLCSVGRLFLSLGIIQMEVHVS
jgi:hypothetical protein